MSIGTKGSFEIHHLGTSLTQAPNTGGHTPDIEDKEK